MRRPFAAATESIVNDDTNPPTMFGYPLLESTTMDASNATGGHKNLLFFDAQLVPDLRAARHDRGDGSDDQRRWRHSAGGRCGVVWIPACDVGHLDGDQLAGPQQRLSHGQETGGADTDAAARGSPAAGGGEGGRGVLPGVRQAAERRHPECASGVPGGPAAVGERPATVLTPRLSYSAEAQHDPGQRPRPGPAR
jgi:hypothetical protein